jgi:PleD family two-component response regulator
MLIETTQRMAGDECGGLQLSGGSAMSATILVVEDELSLATMLTTLLTGEGYAVVTAHTGESALAHALQTPPDLVLLDLTLPGMDGFEVLRLLRAEAKTVHIPVIILTGRDALNDKLHAFNILKVNDYLTKPFNNDELLARVGALVHHTQTHLLSPLTRLPGGVLVERAIEQRFAAGEPWAFVYIDLDHFKALNDGYGFWRGNEMIRMLTRAVLAAVSECGNPQDFIGHIGGEDFVVLTTPERMRPLCAAIITHFAESSKRFYRAEDLARGAFLAVGRDGPEKLFPLVTVSIAVIPSDRLSTHVTFEELSNRAALIKAQSKAAQGNCYIIDGEDRVCCEGET